MCHTRGGGASRRIRGRMATCYSIFGRTRNIRRTVVTLGRQSSILRGRSKMWPSSRFLLFRRQYFEFWSVLPLSLTHTQAGTCKSKSPQSSSSLESHLRGVHITILLLNATSYADVDTHRVVQNAGIPSTHTTAVVTGVSCEHCNYLRAFR